VRAVEGGRRVVGASGCSGDRAEQQLLVWLRGHGVVGSPVRGEADSGVDDVEAGQPGGHCRGVAGNNRGSVSANRAIAESSWARRSGDAVSPVRWETAR
jgi:hypothetical protein